MILNSGSFAKLLWPGLSRTYGLAYDEHEVEYTDLFETRSSDKAYEETMAMSGFGLASAIPSGSSVSYDTASQSFITRFTHVKYGLGFIITREMVEDDQYKQVGNLRAQALAMSMRITKETVGANVYNRAFNASYLGGDGKELCATDHPSKNGPAYANELTVAATLSEAALEQACIDIMRMKNDRGLQIKIMPVSLHIPPELYFEAERILGSRLRVGTANNDKNVLGDSNKFPGGVKVNHYFTDTNNWFIRTNVKGMAYYERRGDDFAVDGDFDTDNAKYKATGRYSFGWDDPRTIFGSGPA